MDADLFTIPGITIIRGAIMLACIIAGTAISLTTENVLAAVLIVDPIPLGLIAVGTYEEMKGSRVLPF